MPSSQTQKQLTGKRERSWHNILEDIQSSKCNEEFPSHPGLYTLLLNPEHPLLLEKGGPHAL